MGKNATDKIAESDEAGQTAPRRLAPPFGGQDFLTVRLTRSGRYFYCRPCRRHHPHPPSDLEFYAIGYGFCDFLCEWTPIEGGDACGIVRMDERGRLYTVERDRQKDPSIVDRQS